MWVLAVLFILSVYFVPASILLRPDYFLLVAICMYGFAKFGSVYIKLSTEETKIISALSIFALLSIAIQIASGVEFSPRDLMVVIRYVVYLAAIYAGIVTALSMRQTRMLRFMGLGLVVTTVGISFAQYFNIGGINSTLVPLYAVGDRYAILEAGVSWRRIIGTMGNPNYWGFFLGLGFIYSSYMCLQKKFFYLLLAVPLFISIIMTGSRASLVATLAAVLIGSVVVYSAGKKITLRSLVPVIFGSLFIGVMYLVFNLFSANYYEAENRFSTENLRTLELRVKWWFEIINEMMAQPHTIIVGRGPAKLDSVRFGDNMYIRYLRDFGIIGLGLYLMLLTHILRKLYKLSTQADKKVAFYVSVTLLGFIQLAVFDLAADGWFNVRIVELLLFCYGLAVGFSYKSIWLRSNYESIHNHS